MIHQLNFAGKDKVQVALERIRTFEPKDGYYLAFSGGKDSCVVKKLMEMSGVKFDAHYNVTSVDPPELVQFIKDNHRDVDFNFPRYPDGSVITMWNLIPRQRMAPTRIVRYCCKFIKEDAGVARFRVTGVRKAESSKRATRGGLELGDYKTKRRERYDVDNAEDSLIRTCQLKHQRILNPIIDWSEDEVWEFIREYEVPYCCLYDEGFKRLGCIGCPMGTTQNRLKQFERWPKYKEAYLRAFEKMITERKRDGLPIIENRETKEGVFEWWIK